MKRRLIQFITTYFLFVFIFILQKPIFMAYYYTLYNKVSWTDWFSVIGHGLPLDLSLAGYLTILPGLLLIASAWTDSRILQLIRRIYFTIISILLSSPANKLEVFFKRPRPIWLLGFPARYHTIVLFLLFSQRCSCQRQPMGGGRRHSCDGGLCSTFIFRLLMDTG